MVIRRRCRTKNSTDMLRRSWEPAVVQDVRSFITLGKRIESNGIRSYLQRVSTHFELSFRPTTYVHTFEAKGSKKYLLAPFCTQPQGSSEST